MATLCCLKLVLFSFCKDQKLSGCNWRFFTACVLCGVVLVSNVCVCGSMTVCVVLQTISVGLEGSMGYRWRGRTRVLWVTSTRRAWPSTSPRKAQILLILNFLFPKTSPPPAASPPSLLDLSSTSRWSCSSPAGFNF